MWYHIPHKERYKLIIYLVGDNQEPITRSLRTNCTLESTLSCILLFLELRYVGGSLISRENMLTFAPHPKKNSKLSALLSLLKYFRVACM